MCGNAFMFEVSTGVDFESLGLGTNSEQFLVWANRWSISGLGIWEPSYGRLDFQDVLVTQLQNLNFKNSLLFYEPNVGDLAPATDLLITSQRERLDLTAECT